MICVMVKFRLEPTMEALFQWWDWIICQAALLDHIHKQFMKYCTIGQHWVKHSGHAIIILFHSNDNRWRMLLCRILACIQCCKNLDSRSSIENCRSSNINTCSVNQETVINVRRMQRNSVQHWIQFKMIRTSKLALLWFLAWSNRIDFETAYHMLRQPSAKRQFDKCLR